MRKTLLALIVLGLGWIAFQAWPVATLLRLAHAVEARDVAAVISHVDIPAVRRSLNDQIVETYRAMTGQTGGSPLLRGIVATAAESIADPLVVKIVEPEALTDFLHTGWPNALLPNRPSGTIGLTSEQIGSAWQLYWNSKTWFRRYEIAVPPSNPPERRLGLEFRLTQWRWRLVAVRIPENLRIELARMLIKTLTR